MEVTKIPPGRRIKAVFRITILSYIHTFFECMGGIFFLQYFANICSIRMQHWKQNLVHWLFLVKKCYLISKWGEKEFLMSATNNLTNNFKYMPVCIITFTTCAFFPSLLSKAYVPSKILFIIVVIILEGPSYENWIQDHKNYMSVSVSG